MLDTSKKLKKVVYKGVEFEHVVSPTVNFQQLEDGSYSLIITTK